MGAGVEGEEEGEGAAAGEGRVAGQPQAQGEGAPCWEPPRPFPGSPGARGLWRRRKTMEAVNQTAEDLGTAVSSYLTFISLKNLRYRPRL